MPPGRSLRDYSPEAADVKLTRALAHMNLHIDRFSSKGPETHHLRGSPHYNVCPTGRLDGTGDRPTARQSEGGSAQNFSPAI